MIFISFALAAAPALLLVRYFYRQDKAKPEPKGLVIKVFLFGTASALAAIPLEFAVSAFERLLNPASLFVALFRAFIVAGLVEEYLKLTVVRLTAYRQEAFDEVMDGVVYTVVAGLGFACLENILYVFGGTLVTALIRAFTAIPLHAVASGMMGYRLGCARMASSSREEKALIAVGLVEAVLVHGLYDFLIFVRPLWGPAAFFGVIVLIVIVFLVLRRRIRAAIASDRRAGRVAGDGP